MDRGTCRQGLGVDPLSAAEWRCDQRRRPNFFSQPSWAIAAATIDGNRAGDSRRASCSDSIRPPIWRIDGASLALRKTRRRPAFLLTHSVNQWFPNSLLWGRVWPRDVFRPVPRLGRASAPRAPKQFWIGLPPGPLCAGRRRRSPARGRKAGRIIRDRLKGTPVLASDLTGTFSGQFHGFFNHGPSCCKQPNIRRPANRAYALG